MSDCKQESNWGKMGSERKVREHHHEKEIKPGNTEGKGDEESKSTENQKMLRQSLKSLLKSQEPLMH